VSELSRLYNAFAAASTLECIALKAAIVLPIFVLQIPNQKFKSKEIAACLERRLAAWKEGDLESLLDEGRLIQHRLPRINRGQSNSQIAHFFANLMMKGKVHVVLDLLYTNGKDSVLGLSHIASQVRQI